MACIHETICFGSKINILNENNFWLLINWIHDLFDMVSPTSAYRDFLKISNFKIIFLKVKCYNFHCIGYTKIEQKPQPT